MQRSHLWSLIIVVIVAILALVIALPIQHPSWFNNIAFWQPREFRDLELKQGLDLQGGLQVLLEADPTALAAQTTPDRDPMEAAKVIVENRVNALGVSESVIQLAGERRIVGEFPGAEDTDAILDIIQQTGLLEFVDTGSYAPPEGSTLQTDFVPGASTPQTPADGATVFHTIMTGKVLQGVNVGVTQTGEPAIDFVLNSEGAALFAEHTAANIGKYLTIVLDKQVISAPIIQNAITGGQGSISGSFTPESANALAVQLRYGSLPIPLKVVETRIIGPTLGEDSLQKSLVAGLIGFLIVALFMIIYYRLPGLAAVLSILAYAAILYAVFKLIGVTLTLPGIAGIMLSTGSALDANILIFERLKEELRSGRSLRQAFDQAWKRAWPSIRDSNVAALITAVILFWFGSSFGATIVKGFSFTLAIGVIISLFSSLYITQSFLALLFNIVKPTNYERSMGI
ncbi:MAG TPA: protein translocase subunit SecD [Anaerolineales bacterium]|nr:protein translocase subunit SecD [Anaerolineales bacterium]